MGKEKESIGELFELISGRVISAGGYGHGYRSSGYYKDMKVRYTAGFREMAGLIETLQVWHRRTLVGEIYSQQLATDGERDIESSSNTGYNDAIRELTEMVKSGHVVGNKRKRIKGHVEGEGGDI